MASTWDMMTVQQQADCADAGRGPYTLIDVPLTEHHGTITGRIPAGGGEAEEEYDDSKPGPLDEDDDDEDLDEFIDDPDADEDTDDDDNS